MNYIIISLLIALMIETYVVGRKGGLRPNFAAARGKQLIFIDTSVLIDARILEVAMTGFMPGVVAVPRSVVGELQYLADNADAEKRSRARHGLDVIQQLKQIERIDFMLFQDGSVAKEGVDERLLKLARDNNGQICTLDYNLNKVAVVEGIPVLNINELAQSLRMSHLPGETLMIELVQKGQDSHQAVGYLPDGTMVVVENAQQMLNKTVQVSIIRSLQTAAGKMMFARLASAANANDSSKAKQRATGTKAVVSKVFTKKRNDTKEQKQNDDKPQSTTQQTKPYARQRTAQRADRTPTRKPQQNRKRDKEDVLMDLVDKQS